MKLLYFMGILWTRINSVIDIWAHCECGMFELQELSAYSLGFVLSCSDVGEMISKIGKGAK